MTVPVQPMDSMNLTDDLDRAGSFSGLAMTPRAIRRVFPNKEWVLLFVLAFECLVFSITGENFLTAGNAFEVTRLAVELGLLALALTPVVISGGIDLSVGSMMGLSAVVLGTLWRDAHVTMPLAIAVTLLVGAIGGALNAFMIARLGFPPLIVTLGTFSLFRGIAEGLTRGVDNYSGFSSSFLFLGQGYVAGIVPAQLFVLAIAAAVWAWQIHSTAFGRTLSAIGYSKEGARYAGIPVARRLATVYLLSGLSSSVAAVIYVAHLGQAKSDAGTGFELMAITAVVLGGASIFGGRGTVLGTILGLFAIVILQNGLRVSSQPAELGGILTGLMLIATILIQRLSGWVKPKVHDTARAQEIDVKNSQVAILSSVILIGALIVAGSNWYLVSSLRHELSTGH